MLNIPTLNIYKHILAGGSQHERTPRPRLMRFLTRERLVWAVTLGLFLLLFSSCGTQGIVITSTQNGQSVQVHTGDTIVLQLDENPSTGFTWEVSKTDATILTLQDSTYTRAPGNPGEVGRGGIHIWTFMATQPGTVHLQLKNWRSFEGASSATHWYNVTLEVQS